MTLRERARVPERGGPALGGGVVRPLQVATAAREGLERPFGEDEVPAAVAETFARGGRNLQRTHDATAERRTAALWDACAFAQGH